MSASNVPTFAPLPRSHYFLTVSRGSETRTFALRVFFVHALAFLLPVLALVGTGASAYILFHDDVVASLMARQTQMQYAYEDRIDAMRGELQRQTIRDTTDRAKIETRIGDLLSRQSRLETRAQLVASLADMTELSSGRQASAAGQTRVPQNPFARMQPALPALPAEALGYAAPVTARPLGFGGASKPHPEIEPSLPVSPAAKMPDSLSSIDSITLPPNTRLSLASASLDQIERIQVGTLVKIGVAARSETAKLQAAIEEVGLTTDRFHRGTATQNQGGPFVPLPADRSTPFGEAMFNLQDTLATTALLRTAVARVPLADPLPGVPEVTSPFGARLDPFLGRPAMHTGVDLHESSGADVRATAAGTVVAAGPAGGYGNMVEIDHGNGLATRYAHMEEILVSDGQAVEKGALVGRVGATGRATGPHLHYEVRVDNEPVDPMRYLNAGFRIAGLPTH